jgi:uncharacterized protein (TIGR01244 family)
MTDLKTLDDAIWVSGQISPEDLPALKAQGFSTVISNRPDGEEPGQPAAAEFEAAAAGAGLDFVHVPVAGGQFTQDGVERFRAALEGADGKVLAFCRSGMRSTAMWALASAGRRPAPELVETAAQAGYDISGLTPYLTARA